MDYNGIYERGFKLFKILQYTVECRSIQNALFLIRQQRHFTFIIFYT